MSQYQGYENIVFKKLSYFSTEACPIVYMGKTYIQISQTSSYCWCDDSINGLFVPVSKGEKSTIMQASSKAMLHGDICALNFTLPWAIILLWIVNNMKKIIKKIPSVPKKSSMVTVKVHFHSVQYNKPPWRNWKRERERAVSWLSKKEIPRFEDVN
jgi:hypothetical protein